MSPCFQGDPGPGYYPQDHAPYASQAACENGCSQLGACCSAEGCTQTNKCDCRLQDGKLWMGTGTPCFDNVCECACDDSASQLPATLTLTIQNMGDPVEAAYGPPDSYMCHAAPALTINGVPICFVRVDGTCDYVAHGCAGVDFSFGVLPRLRACVVNGYARFWTTYAPFIGPLQIRFQASLSSAINKTLYAITPETNAAWTMWQIDGFRDDTRFYASANATVRIKSDGCTPPSDPQQCCWWCNPLNAGSETCPTSLDVTISDVDISGAGFQVDGSAFHGTYTLTRFDLAWASVFNSIGNLSYEFQTTIAGKRILLQVIPRSCDRQVATVSGHAVNVMGQPPTYFGKMRWYIAFQFFDPVFGFLDINKTAAVVGHGIGHDVPNCCPAEEFTASTLNTRPNTQFTASARFAIACGE